MTTALATGTIEGTISASTTAYTIPKIDKYLKEQGFDETTRQTALLTLSAGIGTTVGGDTASTANNAGQTQWNYLTHTELSACKSRLTKCARNQQCIDNVNAEYDRANKTNFDNFENYCTINFDAQRCRSLVKRFQDGTQGTYNLKYLPGLYNDISRLGGRDASSTINTVKGNNAFYGYRVRDIGIVNVNRDNGNEFQALVGELANERLYGGGRGGTVAGSGGYRVGVNSQKKDDSKPVNTTPQPIAVQSTNGEYYKSNTLHNKINNKLPIKISGKFKPQEEKDAIRFSQQQGGGEFKFSDNKNQQGIEGVFVGKTGIEEPVSLKRLTITNTQKVQTKIAENAQQIKRAENLPDNNPHKLPSGTLEKTTIHLRLTNITKEQMMNDLKSYPVNGISTKFNKIILDTTNGIVIIDKGKILEVK